jgi:hypothetical protein
MTFHLMQMLARSNFLSEIWGDDFQVRATCHL